MTHNRFHKLCKDLLKPSQLTIGQAAPPHPTIQPFRMSFKAFTLSMKKKMLFLLHWVNSSPPTSQCADLSKHPLDSRAKSWRCWISKSLNMLKTLKQPNLIVIFPKWTPQRKSQQILQNHIDENKDACVFPLGEVDYYELIIGPPSNVCHWHLHLLTGRNKQKQYF